MTLVASDPYTETVPVPSAARFPIELTPPDGFRAEDPATWPRVEGRLEYVDGRLLYMPPCGDVQQAVAFSTAGVVDRWLDDHPEFFVGGNEAGLLFGRDVRGAEVAVWRREAVGPLTGGYVRVPPILAVEVAGREENEPALRAKAAWYLARGVQVVWLVLPATREVVVVGPEGERRQGPGERLGAHPALPGLEPAVEAFFRQLG
jgi:Uma2 family endonuclease